VLLVMVNLEFFHDFNLVMKFDPNYFIALSVYLLSLMPTCHLFHGFGVLQAFDHLCCSVETLITEQASRY